MKMADFLLIRSGGDAQVLEALAVAADLLARFGDDVQIDIITTEELAGCAELGLDVRRVVAVPPFAKEEWGNLRKPEGDSWQSKLFSSSRALKNLVQVNSKKYRALAEELRLVTYEAVFDLDMTAFSLSAVKMAKTDKAVGFDGSQDNSALPGFSLIYHDSYLIPTNFSHVQRCRQLVARHLDYKPQAVGRAYLKAQERPDWLGDAPYIFIANLVPASFIEAVETCLQQLGRADIRLLHAERDLPKEVSVGERCAVAQHALVTVGGGLEAMLSAASYRPTFFMGDKQQMMDHAIFVASPNDCVVQLKNLLGVEEAPPSPPNLPNNDNGDEGAPKSGGIKLKTSS